MDDLELYRLKAVAEAVSAVLDLLFAEGYGADGRVTGLSDALDILKGRNIGNEDIGQEYDNGPWVSTGSDSNIDVAGHWCFPSPRASTATYDVGTTAVPIDRERIEPNISIERCGQGFLAHAGQDKLAFTDALDVAEWLLGWLGFEDEIVESVRDILAGLWDADELVDRDDARLLDIAQAALGYVEGATGERHRELVEAVKSWWTGTDEEPGEAAKRRRGLT